MNCNIWFSKYFLKIYFILEYIQLLTQNPSKIPQDLILNQTCLRNSVPWPTKVLTFCPGTCGNHELESIYHFNFEFTTYFQTTSRAHFPGAPHNSTNTIKAYISVSHHLKRFLLSSPSAQNSPFEGQLWKPAHPWFLSFSIEYYHVS